MLDIVIMRQSCVWRIVLLTFQFPNVCRKVMSVKKHSYNYLRLETYWVVHVNVKFFLHSFETWWIFQEWNYLVNQEKIVLYYIWKFSRSYLSLWKKITSPMAKQLMVFESSVQYNTISLHRWCLPSMAIPNIYAKIPPLYANLLEGHSSAFTYWK